jgi:hypothetical protein
MKEYSKYPSSSVSGADRKAPSFASSFVKASEDLQKTTARQAFPAELWNEIKYKSYRTYTTYRAYNIFLRFTDYFIISILSCKIFPSVCKV